jgi:hypothetical protein
VTAALVKVDFWSEAHFAMAAAAWPLAGCSGARLPPLGAAKGPFPTAALTPEPQLLHQNPSRLQPHKHLHFTRSTPRFPIKAGLTLLVETPRPISHTLPSHTHRPPWFVNPALSCFHTPPCKTSQQPHHPLLRTADRPPQADSLTEEQVSEFKEAFSLFVSAPFSPAREWLPSA